MRILKFAGAFLLTLIVVFLFTFGYNLDALFTLFENQRGIKEGQEWVQKTNSLKGLTEYIGEQPERVSVVSLAINDPDSSIMYNQHAPRTMGRLSVLFSVIEYARQVEQGTINPDEQVPLSEINRYQLPFIDESSHDDAMNMLNDRQANSESTVALKHVVDAAVAYNDLAITDYLFYKLNPASVAQLMDELLLQETESPLPFSGLYITLNPHLQQREATAHFDSLSQLSRQEFTQLVSDNTERFLNDDGYRSEVLQRFENGEGLDIKFTMMRDALAFFPKTTADEMARLMKQLQQDNLISPAVSARLKEILDWPLQSGTGRLQKDFETYGALYDNRMGMLNGIDFGASSYSGEPFAQAVFFDDLQVAFWFHMSSNLMHQDYQQRLIWDPALRSASASQINTAATDTTTQS